MIGAILTSILKRLSNWKASSSSSTELPSSAEQELQKLERTMRRIHAVLEDAEEKDVSDKSEQLHLRELKEVAYDAEDAVDEYEYELLHAKIEARRQAKVFQMVNKQVTFDLNSYHPKVPISDELAGKVKDIRQRFEEITDDWDRISLREKYGKRRCVKKWKPMETISWFDEAKTFGREDEKNDIIKWLLHEEFESNFHSVSVLCIVGMGGLGKTTIAQMVYSDLGVCQHFNFRGWIYVSQDFDGTNLVRKVYNSFGMNMSCTNELDNINIMSLDELHKKLKANLDGKRFFLVLDDVWSQKLELWITLKTFLAGVVGKILVTTRDEHVAKTMQTTSHVNLSHLSFDNSWLLFKNIAYEGRGHNFLEIAKKIVHKCRGLPLAVKVLAGILRVEDEEEAWVDLLESELWELDEEKDSIFPVLKLSYDYLTAELKQCFMYLCLFPKGSYFSKSNIVQQWMSNGFIQPKGKKMEEDVGNDYCDEFLRRSILQYYSDAHFIMHDLIHDLAQSVAKDEYLLMVALKSNHIIPKTIRHVSVNIIEEHEIINLAPLSEAKHLRTLILSFPGEISSMDFLSNLTCLRTLVLRKDEDLSDAISSMKHLRYLDIGFCKSIPASTYHLHHLHTLGFSSSEIKLSRDIGDLVNLRHLNGRGYYHLPREVVELTNLQTLPCIHLRVEFWELRDLKRLPKLRELCLLSGLETVAWADVTPPKAYLKDKRGIRDLTLRWVNEGANVDERLAAQVLDSLQPHRNLRYMTIDSYPGVVLPAWLGYDLPVLKELQIYKARRVKSFVAPAEKITSSLNPPAAASASDVESRCCFPSLEKLALSDMNELEEWQGAEDVPCLHQHDISSCQELMKPSSLSRLNELMISECPKLRKLPSLSHLSKLEIYDCPELKSLPSLPHLTDLTLYYQFSSDLLFCCGCLPMLRYLDIGSYSDETLIFPDDGSLDPLEILSFRDCPALRSVQGLLLFSGWRSSTVHFSGSRQTSVCRTILSMW